jgi:hypothetical protein
MKESEIQNQIRIACNTGDTRLFRNNIGQARTKFGIVNYGIPGVGGSDLIGFKTITIRQEHVGKKVAVFAAVECKTPKGKPTTEQLNFIDYILKSGGLAGIARSTEDAKSILNEL